MSATIGDAWSDASGRPAVRRHSVSWFATPLLILAAPWAPQSLGSRVTSASLWKAVACAMVSLGVWTASIVFLAAVENFDECRNAVTGDIGGLTLLERVRFPFCAAACDICEYASHSEFFEIAVTAAIFLCLVPSLALLWAPLITHGERWRTLYGRSLKALLWAMSCGLWAAPAYIGASLLYAYDIVDDDQLETAIVTATIAMIFAFLRAFVGFGRRYAGPALGPAWDDVVPRCSRCGYCLTSLQADGVCPECGLPIAESLPERRCLSLDAAVSWGARFRRFWDTLWTIWFTPEFFRALRVRTDVFNAVRFASRSMLLATTASGAVAYGMEQARHDYSEEFIYCALSVACIWAALHVLLGFMCLLFTLFRRRDSRPVVQVVCYTSALLVPCALAATVLIEGLQSTHLGAILIAGMRIPLELIIFLAFCVTAIVWWLSRIRRGLRDVRYASA